MPDTSRLNSQQLSIRAGMIKDILQQYRSGCCQSDAIDRERRVQDMEYGELVQYWQAIFHEKPLPVGTHTKLKK